MSNYITGEEGSNRAWFAALLLPCESQKYFYNVHCMGEPQFLAEMSQMFQFFEFCKTVSTPFPRMLINKAMTRSLYSYSFSSAVLMMFSASQSLWAIICLHKLESTREKFHENRTEKILCCFPSMNASFCLLTCATTPF